MPTRVIVLGVHYGSGVDMAIGPFAPMLPYKNPDGHSVEDILSVRSPELRLIKSDGRSTPDIQERQIGQYAAAIQEHCQDLLQGDFSAVAESPVIRTVPSMA